jgi:hypothetical protein
VVGVDDNDVGVQQEERFRREIMSHLILKRWGWLACEAGQERFLVMCTMVRNPRPKWGEETDKDRYDALRFYYPLPFRLPIEVWTCIALFVEDKPESEMWGE